MSLIEEKQKVCADEDLIQQKQTLQDNIIFIVEIPKKENSFLF